MNMTSVKSKIMDKTAEASKGNRGSVPLGLGLGLAILPACSDGQEAPSISSSGSASGSSIDGHASHGHDTHDHGSHGHDTHAGGMPTDAGSEDADSTGPAFIPELVGSAPPQTGPIDCKNLESTGIEVGQVPPNFTLLNARGEDVRLHDYCNHVVYIISGTMSCSH